MKTIFALFDSYAGAGEAVDSLLAEDFAEEEMNALALSPTVKENMDVNLHAVDVRKSEEIGGKTVHGLAALFGGEQPVHVRGSGDLLAAGELATLLATRASATNNGDDPLQEALEEFGVPRDTATDYRTGIVDGGVLVWVRTQDERASAAASALRAQHGQGVGAYSGS